MRPKRIQLPDPGRGQKVTDSDPTSTIHANSRGDCTMTNARVWLALVVTSDASQKVAHLVRRFMQERTREFSNSPTLKKMCKLPQEVLFWSGTILQ